MDKYKANDKETIQIVNASKFNANNFTLSASTNPPNLQELNNYVNDDDIKLKLRLVSKTHLEWVTRSQKPPYRTKCSFGLKYANYFNEFYGMTHLDIAWGNYNDTFKSQINRDAILYKLKDKNDMLCMLLNQNKYVDFVSGDFDESKNNIPKRIYSPEKYHTLSMNYIWLEAQIQVGRSFVILSPVDDVNIMRRNDVLVYSAFAREVAIVTKFGYSIDISEQGDLRLVAPTNPALETLSLNDELINETEIKNAVTLIKTHQIARDEAKKLVDFLEDLTPQSDFSKIDEKLKQFFHLFTQQKLTSTLPTFLKMYNLTKPKSAPVLAIQSDMTLFMAEQTSINKLIVSLIDYVNQIKDKKVKLDSENSSESSNSDDSDDDQYNAFFG